MNQRTFQSSKLTLAPAGEFAGTAALAEFSTREREAAFGVTSTASSNVCEGDDSAPDAVVAAATGESLHCTSVGDPPAAVAEQIDGGASTHTMPPSGKYRQLSGASVPGDS